jgi:hypothetical protein
MTFSVKQRNVENQRVIGTLWAGDESLAVTLLALFFPPDAQASLLVQRTDDREIPLRINVETQRFH